MNFGSNLQRLVPNGPNPLHAMHRGEGWENGSDSHDAEAPWGLLGGREPGPGLEAVTTAMDAPLLPPSTSPTSPLRRQVAPATASPPTTSAPSFASSRGPRGSRAPSPETNLEEGGHLPVGALGGQQTLGRRDGVPVAQVPVGGVPEATSRPGGSDPFPESLVSGSSGSHEESMQLVGLGPTVTSHDAQATPEATTAPGLGALPSARTGASSTLRASTGGMPGGPSRQGVVPRVLPSTIAVLPPKRRAHGALPTAGRKANSPGSSLPRPMAPALALATAVMSERQHVTQPASAGGSSLSAEGDDTDSPQAARATAGQVDIGHPQQVPRAGASSITSLASESQPGLGLKAMGSATGEGSEATISMQLDPVCMELTREDWLRVAHRRAVGPAALPWADRVSEILSGL